MKSLSFFSALIFCLFITAGCSSHITNLKEQFSPTYHDIVVEAEQDAAFRAALTALGQMGYNITNSGAAQKKIEAISNISHADINRPARQYTASVRFGVAPNNSTAIQIIFTEIHEELGARGGVGTKQPLTDSPLYSVFAKYVDEALKK